jgi:uncharacterized protein YggT (Ycf19 family)
MGLIDFILDIAALLLWLSWRGVTIDPLTKATPATLAGTLRRAEPSRVRHWHFLVALLGLIVLRALLYRSLGPALHWTGQLDLVATRLSFPSDFFQWMLLFSALGFALTLFVFHVLLLLVSILSANGAGDLTLPRLARAHLGVVDSWPKAFQLVLPFLIGTLLYWSATWPLAAWGLVPRPVSETTRLAQSALVGLGSYITWKYLLVLLLALQLLNNHIYFGAHPMWNFVTFTARRVLAPLRVLPLRLGKIDFAPLVGIALVLLVSQIAEHGLSLFKGYRIVGLAEIYRSLSR